MTKTNRIDALQGLRMIAFLCIFVWHLNGYIGQSVVSFAGIAVTFFFMLSGFVSMLTLEKHTKTLEGNVLKKSFIYAKNRISKIYVIYIITLIIYIPLSVRNLIIEDNFGILKYIIFFILNVFLLQSWKYEKFNAISYAGWYLSSLIFLNFITIPLSYIIKKLNKNNKAWINLIFIILSFCGLMLYGKIVPNHSFSFYFYVFPMYRIFEYFIGMCLASIYLKTKELNLIKSKLISTIIEILVIFVIINFIKESLITKMGVKLSILYIFSCMLAIFTFMYQKGYVSKLLCVKPFVFLGNISGEMYIIHNIFTAYLLGILTRILPHSMYFAIPADIFILALTIVFAYILHYKKYENILKMLEKKLIYIRGKFKQKKLKCKDFTIISNNCFGGVFYRNNALEYMSPTCGLFIMPKDYLKLIYNLKDYLKCELKQISIEESNYLSYLKEIKYDGTIGKLNDIEIMFLHYKNFEEAKQKWERRSKRINFNKIIYKFNDQNGCGYKDLLKFEKFKAENKLCFTAKKYENVNSIVFSEFEKIGYVESDSKEKIFKKYIDMYKYINERFGVDEKI